MPRCLARFAAVLLALSLGGCANALTDLDERGSVPIPSRLLGEMRSKDMSARAPVLVRIFKQESEIEVWKETSAGDYALLKTYPMCRWSGRLGPKTREGDRQAPEGFYSVRRGMLNPRSQYHLSFDLGYPNRLEKARGYTGDLLMVHGACSSSGCFAITDASMTEVYAVAREALDAGQDAVQVQSFPFRMTGENMAAHRDDPNFAFWTNLKEGYDAFEVRRRPPELSVCGGGYRFNADWARTPSDDPLSACPARLDTPEPALLARRNADAKIMSEMPAEGFSVVSAYSDGGMHPKFRALLESRGAERLAKMTSGSSTPVSRPDAALADPYWATDWRAGTR